VPPTTASNQILPGRAASAADWMEMGFRVIGAERFGEQGQRDKGDEKERRYHRQGIVLPARLVDLALGGHAIRRQIHHEAIDKHPQ